MGTPEFAATILEDLIGRHEVCAVYTRPDAVRGRGRAKEASPVKRMAQSYGIPVFEPSTLKGAATAEELRSLAPDVICVAAYGMILPKTVLDIPPYGCLNVHASLLPAWRGAAPIERAILAGDEETGVCVMRMEEGLDTGDYCVCRTTPIEGKTAEELSDELANLGSHALLTALIHLEEGAADWIAQDEGQASYAGKVERHELDLSPADSASRTALKVQASSAAHPARCVIAGKPVTVTRARGVAGDAHAQGLAQGLAAGQACFKEKRLFLMAADGAVEVIALKPDGKPVMDGKSFAVGIQGIGHKALSWEAPHWEPPDAG